MKVTELQSKQTNNISNFKLHNLETLDFLTLPTIEEESWLAQNVLKHVFVYAIWLFSLRIVGVSFSIHSTLKTQEKYITNTIGVFVEFWYFGHLWYLKQTCALKNYELASSLMCKVKKSRDSRLLSLFLVM